MRRTEPTAAVLADCIQLTDPATPGPNAFIGTLLPRILKADHIAIGHDGHERSAACADQFARHAVHGGFATDNGFTWHRPIIHIHGISTLRQLLAAVAPAGYAAMLTTPDDATCTELRLYAADGTAVTEETGLGDLRARLATGRPALPVNSQCIGMIIDHRKKGTP